MRVDISSRSGARHAPDQPIGGLAAQAAALCCGQGVEFIGLEESTQKAVEEKLDRLPDGRIHYCAADLKKAGFADASVIIYVGNDRTLFTVVTLVDCICQNFMPFYTKCCSGNVASIKLPCR